MLARTQETHVNNLTHIDYIFRIYNIQNIKYIYIHINIFRIDRKKRGKVELTGETSLLLISAHGTEGTLHANKLKGKQQPSYNSFNLQC